MSERSTTVLERSSLPPNEQLRDSAAQNQHKPRSACPAGKLSRQVTIMEPGLSSLGSELREIWQYRDFLFSSVSRDLTTRYRQTLLGVGWAVIQPLSMMIVISLFFGRFIHTGSEKCPYPIFAFASLICWQYFSTAVTRASASLMVMSGSILKKIYFPRVILPAASVTVPLVDFGVAFCLLLLMMCFWGIAPSWNLCLAPLFVGMAVLAAFAIGLWTSALYVRYRDIFHIVPLSLQLVMFASPVAYPSSVIPPQFRPLYELNPMVAVIDGFRWAVLGENCVSGQSVVLSLLVIAILTISGGLYFRSVQGTFADYV